MTSKPPGDQRNFNALVNAAMQEIDLAEDRAKRHQANSTNTRAFGIFKVIVVALALVPLLMLGGQLKRQLFGISQAAIHLEAHGILVAARAAVEKHHELTGQWPDRVPLPSLEALVAMQSDVSGYQLALVMDGNTWKMDQHGTISGVAQ